MQCLYNHMILQSNINYLLDRAFWNKMKRSWGVAPFLPPDTLPIFENQVLKYTKWQKVAWQKAANLGTFATATFSIFKNQGLKWTVTKSGLPSPAPLHKKCNIRPIDGQPKLNLKLSFCV